MAKDRPIRSRLQARLRLSRTIQQMRKHMKVARCTSVKASGDLPDAIRLRSRHSTDSSNFLDLLCLGDIPHEHFDDNLPSISPSDMPSQVCKPPIHMPVSPWHACTSVQDTHLGPISSCRRIPSSTFLLPQISTSPWRRGRRHFSRISTLKSRQAGQRKMRLPQVGALGPSESKSQNQNDTAL